MAHITNIGSREFLRIGLNGSVLLPVEDIMHICLSEPLLRGTQGYTDAVKAGLEPVCATIRCRDGKTHYLHSPDYEELTRYLDAK